MKHPRYHKLHTTHTICSHNFSTCATDVRMLSSTLSAWSDGQETIFNQLLSPIKNYFALIKTELWKYEEVQNQQNGKFLSKAFTKKLHSVTIIITQRKMQVQILNSLAFLMNSFKISNISNHYKYDYVICQEEQI